MCIRDRDRNDLLRTDSEKYTLDSLLEEVLSKPEATQLEKCLMVWESLVNIGDVSLELLETLGGGTCAKYDLLAEQQKIIQQETERRDGKLDPYLAQISSIDEDLATLSDLLNRRDSESIRRLQSIVGTRVDGTYGTRTAKQVENYREGLIAKRESILATITKLEEKESPIIKSANAEIKRL